MTRKFSSLDENDIAIERELDTTAYDNVKIVADNIDDVELVATDIDEIIESNQGFRDITADVAAADASAVAALASENAAATSETAAQLAEANAEAIYDNFDDRYLGPFAAAPTLDNDGETILVGALYFNTASNQMFTRSSIPSWVLPTADAVNVGILDTGGYLAATNVEGALQELMPELDANTSKLAGIESGATTDQTDAEIRTAVDAATDSHVFTDSDIAKLNSVATGATIDQDKANIDALNIAASTAVNSTNATNYTGSDGMNTARR